MQKIIIIIGIKKSKKTKIKRNEEKRNNLQT